MELTERDMSPKVRFQIGGRARTMPGDMILDRVTLDHPSSSTAKCS